MPDIPAIQISDYRLPFADGTDIVEVNMPSPFNRLGVHVHDDGVHISALSAANASTRCARFRRYTSGQPIAGLDLLNVMLSTTPTYVGTVTLAGVVWHVFHEPTPNVPGMDDLMRRFATAPNMPPTAGGATNV